MADQKEKAHQKTKQDESDDGSGNSDEQGGQRSGGNAGAGRSGKENLGSEKPSDAAGLGSQKPDHSNSD